jgi:hypothetical protein
MSSIPSAINLNGLSQRTYQKTEVFDTPGNHTWTHPLPGQNIEVFVEMYGGGGGGTKADGVNAGDGGDTIWDTVGTAITAIGGKGATTSTGGDGFIKGQHCPYQNFMHMANNPIIGYGKYGNGGYWVDGGAGGVNALSGGSGYPKTLSTIVNNDINLTVGDGGISGSIFTVNGQSGAIIISYNITTTQTPVVVNMQRRDWEHFGEISWRTAANTAVQNIPANTLTTLTIDTEVLDTGNKVALDGSNLFTLQSGTYDIDIYSAIEPGSNSVSSGILRLYNITDNSLALSKHFVQYGSIASGPAGSIDMNGIVNINSAKQFRVEFMSFISAEVGLFRGGPTSDTSLGDRTKFQFKWRP